MRSNLSHRHGVRWVVCANLAAAVVGAGLTVSAEAGDYFVDPSGANGAYTTVQAAVGAVSGQSAVDRANIYIASGIYVEQVTVAKPYVSFIGMGRSAEDVKITFNATPISGVTFGESVAIKSNATAFMARNVTFENSTPDQNLTQALAVRSSADKAIFDNVRFLGYQDCVLRVTVVDHMTDVQPLVLRLCHEVPRLLRHSLVGGMS